MEKWKYISLLSRGMVKTIFLKPHGGRRLNYLEGEDFYLKSGMA